MLFWSFSKEMGKKQKIYTYESILILQFLFTSRKKKKKKSCISLRLISILINCETVCEMWAGFFSGTTVEKPHIKNTRRLQMNGAMLRLLTQCLQLTQTYRWEAWAEVVWSSWAGELECPGFGWRGHLWSFAIWTTDEDKRSVWHIWRSRVATLTKGRDTPVNFQSGMGP